jgi:hypothetical protein
MMEQDNLSRADMVRSPMGPIPPSTPTLPGDGVDPVARLLRPYPELLALPVPDHMRALVETWDMGTQQTARDL